VRLPTLRNLISQRDENVSGVTIASTIEGMRPMLIEIQALVSSAAYGTPQRSSTGFDLRRLNMLLAVLEKRSGFRLGVKDVFLNIAGGIKVDDPAIDLAVISAILSSNEDLPVDQKICLLQRLVCRVKYVLSTELNKELLKPKSLDSNKYLFPNTIKKDLSLKENQLL